MPFCPVRIGHRPVTWIQRSKSTVSYVYCLEKESGMMHPSLVFKMAKSLTSLQVFVCVFRECAREGPETVINCRQLSVS